MKNISRLIVGFLLVMVLTGAIQAMECKVFTGNCGNGHKWRLTICWNENGHIWLDVLSCSGAVFSFQVPESAKFIANNYAITTNSGVPEEIEVITLREAVDIATKNPNKIKIFDPRLGEFLSFNNKYGYEQLESSTYVILMFDDNGKCDDFQWSIKE